MDAGPILDFEQHLKRQLSAPLPGPMVQRQLAPELAFGRHRGPVPADARQAAVLMLVHPVAAEFTRSATSGASQGDSSQQSPGTASETSAADWIIPAIVRPAHMKYHPGQIAIPGGIVEPGESLLGAAVREFEEELGVLPDDFQIHGQLSPVFVFATGAQVTPFVAFAEHPPHWKPNPEEVESVVEIRLADLLRPTSRGAHTIRRGRFTMRAPHFQIGDHLIWGATAMILAEFAAICSAARLHLNPRNPQPTQDAT